VPDDADDLALLDGEADIVQGFEERAFFNLLAEQAGGRVEQGLLEALHGAKAVFLGEVADFDDGHGVSCRWVAGGQLAGFAIRLRQYPGSRWLCMSEMIRM